MIPIQSSKSNVCDFLEKMKSILESVDFDIRRDFIFQRYRVIDDPDDEYTNKILFWLLIMTCKMLWKF